MIIVLYVLSTFDSMLFFLNIFACANEQKLENDEVVVEEDVTGRTSLLEAKDMKSDATSDLQKTSYGRLSDGATAEGGVTEMKDAEVSEMSAVSSRQDKYAAFNVPLSRDAKSPPAKFSVGHKLHFN